MNTIVDLVCFLCKKRSCSANLLVGEDVRGALCARVVADLRAELDGDFRIAPLSDRQRHCLQVDHAKYVYKCALVMNSGEAVLSCVCCCGRGTDVEE